ncbi:MAG: LytTR family transcriptional regulator [Lentimicrobium sp.]|nr:LytTR family transcriptional regulator [Lentimicrobium sp.]
MISDFNQQKDKKLAITENATIKWVYLYNITHIECDGYLISVFVDHLTVPYRYTNSLTVLLSEIEDNGFVQIRKETIVNMRFVCEIDLKTHEIRFDNSTTLKVSRRFWKNIKKYANGYCKSKRK